MEEDISKNIKKVKKKGSKKKDAKAISKQENDLLGNDGDDNEVTQNRKRTKDTTKPQESKKYPKSKMKKKKKDVPDAKENSEEMSGDSKGKVLAIQYLQQWKKFRNVWSFQKVRQVWLLRNMYDTEMVDDDNFEILLEYLAPLKGLAKTTTLEKAEEMLREQEENEQNDKEDESEDEDSNTKVKLTDKQVDRLRQIIQILV